MRYTKEAERKPVVSGASLSRAKMSMKSDSGRGVKKKPKKDKGK